MRVLIVEDEPITRIGYETTVTEAGCIIAGSAATALDALRSAYACKPDVALVDIDLGANADGLWLARELAAAFNTRIIFITGTDDERILRVASLLGTATVLRKPVLPLDLVGALHVGEEQGQAGSPDARTHESDRHETEQSESGQVPPRVASDS